MRALPHIVENNPFAELFLYCEDPEEKKIEKNYSEWSWVLMCCKQPIIQTWPSFQVELEFDKISIPQKTKFEIKKEKFEQAKQKYYKLLPELLKTHKGKYVAIVNDNVEVGEDRETLLDIVYEKYGSQTMYLGEVSEKKRTVRITRPKLIRK